MRAPGGTVEPQPANDTEFRTGGTYGGSEAPHGLSALRTELLELKTLMAKLRAELG